MDENDIKKQLMLEKYEPIAIVGIGLKYPGKSNTLDEFSTFLHEGRSGIVDIPESRWDLASHYSDDPQAKGKTVQSKGGYLDSIDEFDPKFFNISPKEANYCDPQHRLLLECSWNALESANIDPSQLRDLNGGVYIGIAQFDYSLDVSKLSAEDLTGNIGTGTAHSAACGRLSYFLGWRGPSMSIDTACSSSLVALHIAAQGLRRHECNIALCAGINAIHHPRNHIVFSQSNMLSADGHCKTFDDSADGYSRSEGCGVLVLKRLSDAKRDGDQILALVRGSAVAQDGESGGLTVPNGIAQTQLMREALKSGLLEPKDIQYVEAHGTGTSLGDPIEVGAINNVFAESHSKQNPLKIGSIKSNLGHMEAGAGVCGVIKVVQQLQNGLFYPHVNLKNPSRHIPWDEYIVSVPTEVQAWNADRRRAMVNSFGFAGSIATIVLEQAPPNINTPEQTSSTDMLKDELPVFTVSAKNIPALRLQIERYQQFIQNKPDIEMSELCYTSNVGRSHLPARFSAAVKSVDELSAQFDKYLSKDQVSGESEFRGGNVAFLFTGQGSQYIGMGEGLYVRYPVFRHYIDECEELFEPYLGCSIKALVFGLTEKAQTDIHQTLYTQPALFVLEYALAKLWMSWGIKPNILLGHSIGEIVAATISGLFSLQDGVKLVATRARLMQSVVAKGGMVAVQATAKIIKPLLQGYEDVSFGAINGPEQCVISGGIDSLEKIKISLEDKNIKTKTLPVSNGFHSPLMNEVFEPFRKIFTDITFNEPELSFISNLTGKIATLKDVGNAEYWLRHIGEPVNFAAGMQCIQSRGKHVFIEIGPSPALINMGRKCVKQSEHLWVSSLKPDIVSDCQTLQNALASVYAAGLTISWQGYHEQRPTKRKIDLPMYAFDNKRYWLPKSKTLMTGENKGGGNHHPLLGSEITSDKDTSNRLREFSSVISANYPAYLADHIVMGQVVFPGAAYVEVLFALQDALFGETSHLIRNMKIIEPLFLTEESMTSLHTRVNVTVEGEPSVEIFSLVGESDNRIERIHVTAILAEKSKNNTVTTEILDRLCLFLNNSGELERQHQVEDVYALYSELGLPYGPEFQRIKSLSQYANRIAIGKLSSFNTSAVECLPPFILDCAMQTLAGVVNIEDSYLPVSFDDIELLKKPKGELDVVIQLTSSEEEKIDLTADIIVLDNNRPVFIVHKLKLKRVANTMASRRLYHEPKWFKQSFTSNQLSSSEPCHVIVINRSMADFESTTKLLDNANIQLDFAVSAAEAMQHISQQESITEICWFWKTQPDLSGESRLRVESEQNYQELLGLVSALDELGFARELKVMLVTEGAQWLSGDSANDRSEDTFSASSLWGFGHVMLNEYPALKTVLVDLPAIDNSTARDYRVLLDEWSADVQGEHQLAYRQGIRHVKRIVEQKVPHENDAENFELAITEYGQFENIKPVPIDDIAPTGDQVCVAVKASGINFKDVLNALGMLKQYAVDNDIEYKPLPLGFESSGTVTACGPDAEFNIGDDVIVSQLGCMQKRLTVSSDAVVLKPTTISFSEAAGLSAAYVTAYYSLHNLADIKKGDRVLIHAAAGGVGQAAVQLAKFAGAEIYATASSRKWALLKSQGVKHVMNSRTLDFTDELLEMTGGQGVDIVLNSLNKDYVPASLKCLGKNGRFVELGKIGIWSKEQMQEARPDVNYQNFDLSEFDEKQLKQINKQTLEIVVDNIDQGNLAPLPTVSYSLEEVEEAFTVLSQGRNVGKLVLCFDDTSVDEQPVTLNENETYLVTGGFGALGRATLRKLAAEGARHITLMSRKLISSKQLAEINADIGENTQLFTVQGDISNAEDVYQMLASIKSQGKPLAGVFHAAGVLSDGLLANQSWESFQRVFEAKIYGTWLLHKAVSKLSTLRFFVVYSSISSVLGMPGQSNYAAANSYMDTLMQWRKANNKPGLSINWGPWAEIGMAAELSSQQIKGIESQGVKFIKPAEGTRRLYKSLGQNFAQKMICEFDWQAFQSSRPMANALLQKVVPKNSELTQVVDINQLISQSKSDRELEIRDILRAKVAAILRFESPDEVVIDAKFIELGLDSLSSVELKNGLESTFKMPFPTAMLFDYSDIKSLSTYLSEQLVPSAENNNGDSNDDIEIEDVSDADADAELAELQEFS